MPARGATHGFGEGLHRPVLTHDALMDVLLHLQELLPLRLEQPAHVDARPAAHDGGHVVLGDLLFQHAATSAFFEVRLRFGHLFFHRDNLAVAKLRRPPQISLALGALGLGLQFLDAFLKLPHPGDGLFLIRPLVSLRPALFIEGGDALAYLQQTLPAVLVFFPFQGALFNAEPEKLSLLAIDVLGQAVQLEPQTARGLIDQVDGLIRQVAVADVAMREHDCGDQGVVQNADAVVNLVSLLQTAQDGDGVFYIRLIDQNGLKTALERRILLDVFSVFIERGGAHAVKLPTGERRLQDIGGVHRPLRSARAHDGVKLVDEQDYFARGLAHFFQHGLEPVLEFTPEFRTRDERTHVETEQALALETLGHVAVHDALGQALDDGGLAHAGVSDEHRVVLRAPGEHLHDAPDLLASSHDGVEFAGTGMRGEVDRETLERLVAALRILIGDALAPPDFLERCEYGLAVETGYAQDFPDLCAAILQCAQEQMFAAHVFIRHGFRFALGRPKERRQLFRDV